MRIMYSCSSIVLLFLSFLPTPPLQAALLNVIDKTWQIAPNKYSITNGAILWELEWLHNFYRFANFNPTKSLDAHGREVIGYDPATTDNVTKLVRILFHQVAGSTAPTDFNITKNINPQGPDAAHHIAKLVAEIIVGLEGLSTLKESIAQTKNNLEQEIEQFEKNPIADARAIITARKNLATAQKNFEATNDPKKLEHAYMLLFRSAKSPFYLAGAGTSEATAVQDAFTAYQQAQTALSHWTDHTQALLKLHADKFFKVSPHEFTSIVGGALKECDPNNQDALYPEGLVHAIWLGFLYKALNNICSQHEDIEVSRYTLRQAFQKYYEHLGKLLGQKLELSETIELLKIIPPLAAAKILQEEFVNNPLMIETKLDSALFYAIKYRLLPPLLTSFDIDYKPFGASGPNCPFNDCMENGFANFIFVMSYNLASGTNEIPTLTQRLNLKLSPLAQQRLASCFQNINDHALWAKLLSNIPYVPYIQATNSERHIKKLAKNGHDFMRVEDNLSLISQYQARGYQIITAANEICYEIRPSVKTLIIVLNYVFDLQLFDDVGQEALRADFVTHYFPKLSKALLMEGYLARSINAQKQDENINFDEIDQKENTAIYSILKTTVAELSLEPLKNIFFTSFKHGTYSVDIPGGKSFKNRQTLFLEKSPLGSVLVAKEIFRARPKEWLLQNISLTPIQQYFSFFILPLSKQDYRLDIESYIDLEHPHLNSFLVNLALSKTDIDSRLVLLNELSSLKQLSPALVSRVSDIALEALATSSENTAHDILIQFAKQQKNDPHLGQLDFIRKAVNATLQQIGQKKDLIPFQVRDFLQKNLETDLIKTFLFKNIEKPSYQQDILNIVNQDMRSEQHSLTAAEIINLILQAYNSNPAISQSDAFFDTLINLSKEETFSQLSNDQKNKVHYLVEAAFRTADPHNLPKRALNLLPHSRNWFNENEILDWATKIIVREKNDREGLNAAIFANTLQPLFNQTHSISLKLLALKLLLEEINTADPYLADSLETTLSNLEYITFSPPHLTKVISLLKEAQANLIQPNELTIPLAETIQKLEQNLQNIEEQT